MEATNRINVTEKNIPYIFPYQGNDTQVKIGDVLQIEAQKIACVTRVKGQCLTFSIYGGELLEKYKVAGYDRLNAYTWMYNRYSINDKFTK